MPVQQRSEEAIASIEQNWSNSFWTPLLQSTKNITTIHISWVFLQEIICVGWICQNSFCKRWFPLKQRQQQLEAERWVWTRLVGLVLRRGQCWRPGASASTCQCPDGSWPGTWRKLTSSGQVDIGGGQNQNCPIDKSKWASCGEATPVWLLTWRSENDLKSDLFSRTLIVIHLWRWNVLNSYISSLIHHSLAKSRCGDILTKRTRMGMGAWPRRSGSTFSTPLGCQQLSKH